jgi:hypothetical protein
MLADGQLYLWEVNNVAIKGRVQKFCQKSRGCLKVLGAERVARSRVRIEDSQYWASPFKMYSPMIWTGVFVTVPLFVPILYE